MKNNFYAGLWKGFYASYEENLYFLQKTQTEES